MAKKIEDLTFKEKFDLVEYCGFQMAQLKNLIKIAKTELDKSVLNNYFNHLKKIIEKVKETTYVSN